jgi:O-antigen/teichoic acid export membrane protein
VSAVVETRAAKATLAAGLSMGLSIGLQLVSVPICLRYWGEETYGLWLALISLATLVRTPDFAFSAYVGNEINLQYHRDAQELRTTLASAVWGGAALALVEALAGVAILASGRLAPLLGIPEEVAEHGRAGLAFAVLMLGFVSLGPFLGIVHKLLVPAGMLHQATWWFMGLQIAQTSSLVVAAALGMTLGQAAALFVVCFAVLQGASAIYVARKLPGFFPWWRNPSPARAWRDLVRSAVMGGALLLTQASTNGAVMVVSAGLGAASVPAFTTVRTLTTLWTTLTNVLTGPLLPDVVRYHAQREPKKLVAMLEANWLISNAVVNLSVVACLPFLDTIYHTWTRRLVALDPGLLCLLLLAVVVGTPGALIVVYLTGINDLRAVTAVYSVRGLAPLVVGALLLPTLGVAGLGIGIVLGELLGPVVVGGLYLREHLRRAGSHEAPRWQPIALGSALASGFIGLQWAGGLHAGLAHVATFLGVLATVFWGWRGQSPEVRERVLRFARRASA